MLIASFPQLVYQKSFMFLFEAKLENTIMPTLFMPRKLICCFYYGAHFPNCLWAYDSRLWHNSCFNHKSNEPIWSQFFTCHNSWAVVTCANLSSQQIIICLTRDIFVKFGLWTHNLLVKWVLALLNFIVFISVHSWFRCFYVTKIQLWKYIPIFENRNHGSLWEKLPFDHPCDPIYILFLISIFSMIAQDLQHYLRWSPRPHTARLDDFVTVHALMCGMMNGVSRLNFFTLSWVSGRHLLIVAWWYHMLPWLNSALVKVHTGTLMMSAAVGVINQNGCKISRFKPRQFLAATKQLYKWYFPSVRLSVRLFVCPSVCLSVTPFWLCSHHRIIMKFSGVITNDQSKVHAKGQGQRSQRSQPNLTVSGL